MASIATSAPEVLIAHAAAVTTRIRLGAGGIMVPNHAPLHVVEVFRTLEALHPAASTSASAARPAPIRLPRRRCARGTPTTNQQLAELLAFERAVPRVHPSRSIVPMPSDVAGRRSGCSARRSPARQSRAQLGVPYAFAGHFAMRHANAAIAHYQDTTRRRRTPDAVRDARGDRGLRRDDDEAARLAAPLRVAIVKNRTGRRAPIVASRRRSPTSSRPRSARSPTSSSPAP